MAKHSSQPWVPLYKDKWLWGSTRYELPHAERAIFTDFLALATMNGGYICPNDDMGYSEEALAGMLHATVELIHSTIELCIQFEKLERFENGILKIVKWEEYQHSDRYVRKISSAKPEHYSAKPEHSSEKAEPRGEEKRGDKRRGDKRTGGDSYESSPWLPLAERILENAKKNNPTLDKGAGYDETKKLATFAKDLSLLHTRTWPHLTEEEAVKFANDIWDWAVTYEGADGYRWSDNIESGYKFYLKCSPHLKDGGTLISKYYTLHGKPPAQNRGVGPVSKPGTRTFGGGGDSD